MMKQKRVLFFLTAFFAGLLLMTAPFAGASINTGTPSYDSLLQSEFDRLLNQVSGQFEATGDYLEKAEFDSVLEKGLASQGRIKEYYDLALEAQKLADNNPDNPELQEKARIAMDDFFLAVLYQIQLDKALAATDHDITQALIDILEGRGEGFSEEPAPFALDPLSSRELAPVIPPEDDPVPIIDDEVAFLFYGKAYDLDDVVPTANGILNFDNSPYKISIDLTPIDEYGMPSAILSYPASAMPLALHTLPDPNNFYEKVQVDEDEWIWIFNREAFEDSLENIFDDFILTETEESIEIEFVPQNIFEVPTVGNNGIIKKDEYYRYTWNKYSEGGSSLPPFSATLYKKSNYIAFSYDDLAGQEYISPHLIFSGLTPGDGSGGQPGAGLPRGIVARLGYEYFGIRVPLDLSQETGKPFFNTTDEFCDYLLRLGSQSPTSIIDYVTLLNEEGKNIITNEDTGENPGQSYLTIGEAYIYLGELQTYIVDEIVSLIDEEGYDNLDELLEDVSQDFDVELSVDIVDVLKDFLPTDFSNLDALRQELNTRFSHYLEPYAFDLSEKFMVFIPDAAEGFTEPDEGIGNRYTVHTGNPFMIVDRSQYHHNNSNSSLDEAIIHIGNSPGIMALNPDGTPVYDFRPGYWDHYADEEIEGWDGLANANDSYFYWPPTISFNNQYPDDETTGKYMYGLQTIGYHSGKGLLQYTPWYTQSKLEKSNFLAYVVQVEEDRVNEKILSMSGREDWNDLVNGTRDYKNIRDRDAFFVKNADAQAGRVMKDIHGNWVRVQQYILRPDSSTVKVLNVSLREGGGDLSGMSTIDFTTKFTSEIPADKSLRSLPWNNYLTTLHDQWNNKFIKYFYNPEDQYGAAPVQSMSVKFSNPGNESVAESRAFYGIGEIEDIFPAASLTVTALADDIVRQYVSNETLTLVNAVQTADIYQNQFDKRIGSTGDIFGDGPLVSSYQYTSYFSGNAQSGYYGSNQTEFDRITDISIAPETKILDVNFYRVHDDYSGMGPEDLPGSHVAFEEFGAMDIWKVLLAGEWAGPFVYPHESIEIVMNNPSGSGFFTNPIDTIYIPMSHMVWNWRSLD